MTENLEKYESNERRAADKLFSLIPTIEKVEYTKGRVAYDALVTLNNHQTVLVEVKVRDCCISTYPNYILQVDKLVNLIKYKVKNGYDFIYYVNFFNHPTNPALKDCIVFDIGERAKMWKTDKPKVQKIKMNNETHKSTDYKVLKDVILLEYDEKLDMKVTLSIN